MSQMDSNPSTPPMTPDHAPMAEPPSWPKVIGIISIVWGSLGVACNLCTLIGSVAGNAMLNLVPEEQRAQVQAQQQAGGVLTIVLSILALGLAGMLLAAGIMTLNRRALGRTLHLVYGVVGILLAFAGTGVGWTTSQAGLQAIQSDPSKAAAAQAAQGATMLFLALGLCVGIAYPIFVLIWFGLVKRKASDMGSALTEPLV